MAQTVVFITVSDDTCSVTEVDSNIPTEDDIINIATDYNLEGQIRYSYVAGNIGEGESGVDFFYSEDELREEWCANTLDEFLEKDDLVFEEYTSGSGSVEVSW